MYKFEVDKVNNRWIITVWGFYTPELANEFVQVYSREVKKVIPTEYTLVVDAKELSTSRPESLPILKECLKFYMAAGFKKLYIIEPNTATGAMQCKRVAKEVAFTGIFVKSIEEIV